MQNNKIFPDNNGNGCFIRHRIRTDPRPRSSNRKLKPASAGQAARTDAAAQDQAQKTQAATGCPGSKTQAAAAEQAAKTQAAAQKQQADETNAKGQLVTTIDASGQPTRCGSIIQAASSPFIRVTGRLIQTLPEQTRLIRQHRVLPTPQPPPVKNSCRICSIQSIPIATA